MKNSPSHQSQLTKRIVDIVRDVAEQEGCSPLDVRHCDLMRSLKECSDIDQLKRHLSLVGGLAKIKTAYLADVPSEYAAEKTEMREQAKSNNVDLKTLASDELFLTRFEEVMSKLPQLKPHSCAVKTNKGQKTDRVVTLMLSDLHFGSDLDPRELPVKFGFAEEARALASVMVRLGEFKKDYRDKTELVIWIGGDVVHGKLHDSQDGRPFAEQSADAIWLLSQAIRYAAGQFKKVTVYASTGNHDRQPERHHSRAFNQKWDSRSTIIYFGVKMAVAGLKNVEVNIPRTPFAEWSALGHRFFASHGDVGFTTGNPSKRVNLGDIDRQMTSINLSEVQSGKKPYGAFLAGHMHQGLHLPLPSGQLVMNPALIPVDGYAQGVGFPISLPGQVIFETTVDHVVGDLRFLFIGKEILADKSLDSVIVPFKDF